MDQRTRMLSSSINKLLRRGADRNIRGIISKTHDADVASLIESLDTTGRVSVFQLIPTLDRQANILSHISTKFQLELAHVLEIGKLQKILREMESDDAADLIRNLPEDLSQQVLNGLNKEELQEVEELLSYSEDSAGGIMSSEFLTLNENLTVRDSIEKIQSMEEDLISFYIYVINDASKLVGVLSLKQLLLSRPKDVLKEIMLPDVISVTVHTDQNEVAKIVEKYDFLSLPVTDENQGLVGVITVDDVIDVIREEAAEDIQAMGFGGADLDESIWVHFKARLPWLFLAFTGGAFCYTLLWFSLLDFDMKETLLSGICLLPMSFFLVSTLSSQTVTTLVSFLRTESSKFVGSWYELKKELVVSLSITLLLSLLFALVNITIQKTLVISLALTLVLTLQMIFSILISMLLPLFVGRLNFDPIVSAPLVSMILSNVVAVGVLVMYYAF